MLMDFIEWSKIASFDLLAPWIQFQLHRHRLRPNCVTLALHFDVLYVLLIAMIIEWC